MFGAGPVTASGAEELFPPYSEGKGIAPIRKVEPSVPPVLAGAYVDVVRPVPGTVVRLGKFLTLAPADEVHGVGGGVGTGVDPTPVDPGSSVVVRGAGSIYTSKE